MRAVLYTHDFEPITALTLTGDILRYLDERETVVLAVMEPMWSQVPGPDERPERTSFRTVTITREWMHRRGERFPLLFTRNEEEAMLLRSTFLPGQRLALRQAEDEAFSKGVEWLFRLSAR